MSVDSIVRDGIAALNIGLTKGTNLFGPLTEPGDYVPVNAVFVTLTGGMEPYRASGGDEIQPGLVDVIVRWGTYEDGLAKAQAIQDGLQGVTLAGLIDIVATESMPTYIGQAYEGYHRFTMGFRATRNKDVV